MHRLQRTMGLIAAATAFAAPAVAADITGAGATFPAPVYSKWAEVYKEKTGNQLNYQAIGSGGGIKQIKVKTVDFGATDAPMTGKQLKRSDLLQFPAVIGGIVPVVNLEGVTPGQLTLDGKTLAAIFSGKIKKWDDSAIKSLNNGVSLPSNPITVVYRSDSSGTTAGFTTFLADVDPGFKDAVGAGKTVNWPTGIGGKGNAGVAANVLKLKNSIGYVEYAYAKQNEMLHAGMLNKAGKSVQPDASSFAAAAAGADWSAEPGFGISLNNQGADDAWPITSASFILMYRKPEQPEQSAEALKFFRWALNEGQELALALDYVPLPKETVALVQAAWKEIVDGSGSPVLPSK
ncbi:MAG: phosphate ABC transporter substrate-binding protein PstS [Burkholderiaceae bacterium]